MDNNITVFLNDRRIASGERAAITRELAGATAEERAAIRAHEDATGRVVDLDFRAPSSTPKRGRPSLGVTAREVTLLPRHWDWLATQRGGASAAIRLLIDAAAAQPRTLRARQDAAYAFMAAACGDRAGYEEALRLLYRGDGQGFVGAIADWPGDVRDYIGRLLGED